MEHIVNKAVAAAYQGERQSGVMQTCWRCGITFDTTDFLPGAPCADCQWDVDEPELGWLSPNGMKKQMQRDYQEKRRELVKHYYDQGYGDRQIGERLKMNVNTVGDVRRDELKLPANPPKMVDNVDPIGHDQLLKQFDSGVAHGGIDAFEPTRAAHAKLRLKYGWPEEAAHWAAEDAKEAAAAFAANYFDDATKKARN